MGSVDAKDVEVTQRPGSLSRLSGLTGAEFITPLPHAIQHMCLDHLDIDLYAEVEFERRRGISTG